MASDDLQVNISEDSEILLQIQEKTVSSNTEDKKVDELNISAEEKPVTNGHVDRSEDVQASDTPIDEKKSSTEASEEKEDLSKGENVTSTEEAPTTEVENADSKTGNEEQQEEDDSKKKDDGLGSTVAKHYNEIQAGSKEGRKESRIFYLRNFNNWVKSVIINEYLEKIKRKKRTSDVINVLDLACGKGGDLLKWQKGKVDHVIMADIAATSIDHCKERYSKLDKDGNRHRHSRDRLFTIETYAADCTKELLKEKYKKPDIKLDLTSCQFAFHYSFESYEQADMMLRNACENLQVGGYFIGTTPDAQRLVKYIQGCKADSFGNSVFNIKPSDKEKFPLYGAKYMFYLEGVVDCPEFIVYMPALEKMAEKYNMKLVWKKNFHDLFKQYERQYSSLLQKMNALEHYPAKENKTLSGGSESQYKSAKDFLASKSDKHLRVGTLSADEWEVAGLYLAFAFEKIAPPPSSREGRSDERGNRKRHRDDRSRDSNKSRERHGHSHHDKRKSSESSVKRTKKDSDTEEYYEVKDEIYEDEVEKIDVDTAKVEVTLSEQPDTTVSADQQTETVEKASMETQESVVQEAASEETGTEDVIAGNVPEEVGEEATEEKEVSQ